VNETDPGFVFRWGPVTVARISAVQRGNGCYRVLRITPEHGRALDIYISPSGCSMRVFADGIELKAPS
jgi:hypothetical protein